jgi:capsular polysaccharide biosynthesis protein
MYKNELEIDVLRCFKVLAKKWKVVVLVMLLFFIGGWAYTIVPGEDLYSSTATVYAASDKSYSESTSAVTAMNAYLDVAKSYKVGQRAALILGRGDIEASDLMRAVSVGSSSKASSNVSNFLNASATIVYFKATSPDPELAMAMADAMAESYTIEMASILKTDSVKMLDSAYKYTKSYNAKIEAWKTRLLLAAVGLFIAAFVVVCCEILDRKVRTVREATIRNSIPIIGMIPDYKN